MATIERPRTPSPREAEEGLWSSEQLVLCADEAVGLRAAIAVDDTTRGPALGGVRFKPYATGADAVREARRLAAGMTRKNALAELPYGGGKSVIVDDGAASDREALMERFGAFVARLGGTYLPGVDMGTTPADLRAMNAAGAEVSCDEEDPSPWTALGVHAAIRAAVAHVDGRDGLEGASVLVQGAGHVGAALCRLVAADGGRALVCDVDRERAQALADELGGRAVAPEDALRTRCDVLAPSAIARVLDPATAAAVPCRIVAGAANDTLSGPEVAGVLARRGVTYVPDYVANAGGVVHIHALRAGWDEPTLRGAIAAIGPRVAEVLAEARAAGVTPLAAAEARAARLLAA